MRRRGLPLVFAVAVVLTPLVPATAAAARNHPPGAPTHLTVDGRTNPLAIDGVPHFSWLPKDRDAGETQSAYQLIIRHGDRTIWDSGRVADSRQSWVAGPALAAGTTYRWSVRTWDRRGTPSPFATPADFDTGLADGDWDGAAWIRRTATGNDAANDWTLARKVIQVRNSPVTRARVYVAGTGDWELRADGRAVTRGSSYGYPGEGYYDVAAPKVTAGRAFTIGIRYHYWNCRCQGRANGPIDGPSGLLVKVVLEHADGTRAVTVSDGSWHVSRDTAQDVSTVTYRNSDAGDVVERYDATRELTGWDTARFDDSAWAPATVVGPHPRPTPNSCAAYGSAPCTITHLAAQQAHLSRWTTHPVSTKRLPDGTIFVDMGSVVSAVPNISFRNGTAGHQVTMTTSYRRNNTTLTAPATPNSRTISLANTTNIHPGDEIVVDAPANGFGPGAPETRRVVTVNPQGTVELNEPLRKTHAAGAWVENSRAGTSGLDTQGSDMRFHYTQKAGKQVAEPFTYWGWRYLEISDPGTDVQITAVVQATDVRPAEAATFASSDPTLDAVFELMRHSALMSAQNVFLDTPTREKGQFLGDAIDISFATMASLGERSLTRQAIVEFAHSQSRYWPSGALNAVYPNGDGRRDIPDYTEMFPEWVMRYHQETGDDSLVTQVFPAMRRVADYVLASVDDTGLVHQLPGGSGAYANGIIDWPSPMRYGYVVADNGSRTVVNALAVGALRAVADAATVTGDPTTAAVYRQRADAIATAMNERLRDPSTGYFSDGLALSTGERINSFAQHSQSFPIAYGVTSPQPGLGDYLDQLGMRQGPMTLRQLLDALAKTGHTDTIVRLLTDPTADGPARTLAEGGTFLWEQWTPGCAVASCTGAAVNQSSSESFSHGWGAAGIVAIQQSLLGVTATSPGAATVRITPPAAGLQHASGTVWTERGALTVKWARSHKGVKLDVTIPVNVTATIVLPNGKTVTAGSGRTHVES
jgi:hypothetical protein